MFDLKKYRGVIFHDTDGWFKISRKTDVWFRKWHKEYCKFSPKHLKVSRSGFWWDRLIHSRKSMSLKSTGELCVMIMENDPNLKRNWLVILWHHGIVVITTAEIHLTKPELRFCADSNRARGVSEVRHGEDLWQWSRVEIKINAFCRWTIPQKQFIIIIMIIISKLAWGIWRILTRALESFEEFNFNEPLFELKGVVFHRTEEG